jgi:hypothetical protein
LRRKKTKEDVMAEGRFQVKREWSLVPGWAIGLAVVGFFGIQLLMTLVLFPRDPNPPPVPFQFVFGGLLGSVLAFLILLVGYVNRDAKRRGMNSALWTALVIFIPNAIGFILYFLLRQPLRLPCPGCGAALNPGVNYCPHCRASLRPTCPECRRAIEPGDKYCAHCGLELRQTTPRLQQV